MGISGEGSINIQLVRIGLVISVGWEHGTKVDNIAPEPTPYHMSQVGYNTMLAMYEKNECCLSNNEFVNNDTKDNNPVFLLCRLKINHMMRYKLCVYSSTACSHE
jgi:hypothetical protein